MRMSKEDRAFIDDWITETNKEWEVRTRWFFIGFSLRRIPYKIGREFRRIIWRNPLIPKNIGRKLLYISKHGFGRMKYALGKEIKLDKETTEKIIRFSKWQDQCNKKGK